MQLGLENFQGLRMHSLSGQPAPLSTLHCPPGEETASHIQPRSPLFLLKPFVSVLPPCTTVTSLALSYRQPPCRYWGLLLGPPALKPPLLQAVQAPFSQPFLTGTYETSTSCV